MSVRLVSDGTAYRLLGWATTTLLVIVAACAPVPPPPLETPVIAPVPVVPTADARALEAAARRDARERLWAAITLSPEVIPGGPTFVGAGPDASRLLDGIGCRFAVLNNDTVERRFGGMRLTVQVTTRLGGHPVANTLYLSTTGFSVPAGGSTVLGRTGLSSNGAGLFEYQVGGGWEGESWGRVYRGPIASKDAFIALDVPAVTLTLVDSTVGSTDRAFPVTGCQLSA